eukprot:GFUD01013099.1.p1 GENE.GFUD01013099.1~~GFUD01013099.1.p1  ORF type:complete len:221 (-),score=56.48 GFUD01013099.1:67-729(-)
MAGILAGNDVEQEYLWSCTLTGSDKEYNWAPEDPTPEAKEGKEDDENDGNVKPGHRLLIKSAILMPSAKKDEVTIVQIESEGYNKKAVIVPICAMKGGSDYQQYVDLLVPTKAKLKLLHGEGPISLIGSHCVDYSGFRDVEAVESEDEDEATDNDDEMDVAEEVKGKGDKKTPTKETKDDDKAEKTTIAKEDSGSKKRKASTEQTKSAEKKKKESPAKSK